MKQPSPRALLGKLFGGSAKGIAVEKSLITGYAQVGGKAWDKTPPAPRLPKEVIEKTSAKYQEALTRLMG